MAEPNDRLRRARERTASPHASGEPLTRQELAELVNGWLFEHTGRTVELDSNYVGKLEQGVIRWPQDSDRRAAFRVVLNADTDADLGFRRPRRSSSTIVNVDRQDFIRAALGVAAGAAVGQSPFAELVVAHQPTPVPTVVGAAEVAEVRAAATVFRDWDFVYGSGLIREAAHAQLRHCAELLNARCSATVRNDLFAAVGYLGETTGFMAFDAYAHDDAQRMFKFALACAEEAGDWHLRAAVLSSMARQSIWRGDPDAGLTFTELAMVRADRLTATERAMLHTVRARALAKLGRIEDTARAVGAADEEFSHRPGNDRPWMAYYDSAQHNGDTGHALWDTAIDGRFGTEARARLKSAVDGHDDGHSRSRAISQIKLASLTMSTGDPTEAAALGVQALDWAGPIRSRRAADDLRELRRLAAPHEKTDAVAGLTSRIGRAVAG